MKHSKYYHHMTFIIVIIILLWSKMGYTVCKPEVYHDITTQLTAEGLSRILDKWKQDLTTECYYYIGKQYLSFYSKSLNVQHLSEAIRFLEYASNHLRPFGPIYEECKQFYHEATLYNRHHHKILQMNDYLSDPTQNIQIFQSEGLQQDDIQELLNMSESADLQLDVIKKFLNINKLLKSFQTELAHLKNNQSLEQVKKIIQQINQLKLSGIKTNNPEIQAIQRLEEYHKKYLISNNKDLNQRCNQLEISLSSLQEARHTFVFLNDILHVGCLKNVVCLVKEIQSKFDTLMPDYNHENDYPDRLAKCQQYLQKYKNIFSQCKNIENIEDQEPKLKKIIRFYKDYNSFNNPEQDITPTLSLEEFMIEIQHNNENYARELYALAGFYIATYYYSKSLELLNQGPGESRKQTLDQINKLNKKLLDYKGYIQISEDAVDVIQQYQLLPKFFNTYLSNPNATSTILRQINNQIKRAWHLPQLLRDRIAEVRREEALNNMRQHMNQPISEQANQSEIHPQQQQTNNQRPINRNQSLQQELRQNLKVTHDRLSGVNQNAVVITFEKFAIETQEINEHLSCDLIKRFFPENHGKKDKECLEKIKTAAYQSISNFEDRFRYFVALALIRKVQNDLNNWVENLAIAYQAIQNISHKDQKQRRVKMELAKARLYAIYHKQNLEPKIEMVLKKNKLWTFWNHNNAFKNYLEIYDRPLLVRVDLERINCIATTPTSGINDQLQEKRKILSKLLSTYILETDAKRRSVYTFMFHEFVNNNNCISESEKLIWLRKWNEN